LTDPPTSPKFSSSEPTSSRAAQYGLMIRYLSPAGICVIAVLLSWYIEALYPQGDSRNFGGPCCALLMGIGALIYIFPAIKELLLPNGVRVFLVVATGWTSVVVLCWLFFWLVVRFKWFQ
jgi:hypothetical protein